MVDRMIKQKLSSPLTAEQKMFLEENGFSICTAKHIEPDKSYQGWSDPRRKDQVVERVIEINREIESGGMPRDDLPPLYLMEADNALPKVVIPPIYATESRNLNIPPTREVGVKHVPVVVSKTLLSPELGLTPEEVAAVVLNTIKQYYDRFNLGPLTEGTLTVSGGIAGVGMGMGGALTAVGIVGGNHDISRRDTLKALAGGAFVGGTTGAFGGNLVESQEVPKSKIFYSNPIVTVNVEQLATAKAKIAEWEAKHSQSGPTR